MLHLSTALFFHFPSKRKNTEKTTNCLLANDRQQGERALLVAKEKEEYRKSERESDREVKSLL